MVFKRSGRKLQHRWYYGNCEIMQVNTFTYLQTAAVYGELGRAPLGIVRKECILKYWFKIVNSPCTLMHKMYTTQKELSDKSTWASQVKSLLSDLGYSYLWDADSVSRAQLHSLVQRLYDQNAQHWFSLIENSSKLDTYCTFKLEYCVEKYVSCINIGKHRSALARFRCSSHKLEIETGRYKHLDRPSRLCHLCNTGAFENEYNFLLVWSLYRDLRKQILPKYYCSFPSINKFRLLVSSNHAKTLRQLGKFIYCADKLRSSILT
jgi:hypothetical protein